MICGVTSTFRCKVQCLIIVTENIHQGFLTVQLSKLLFFFFLNQFLRLPRNCKSCLFFVLSFPWFCLLSCVFLVSFFFIIIDQKSAVCQASFFPIVLNKLFLTLMVLLIKGFANGLNYSCSNLTNVILRCCFFF